MRSSILGTIAAVAICLALSACGSSAAPADPDASLTGLGATRAIWDAHHGPEYSTVVTNAAGRVEEYVLDGKDRSFADAEAAVRADLPPDAQVGADRRATGDEGTTCRIVDFASPTLGRVLGGDGHATAVFATITGATGITAVDVYTDGAGAPSTC